MDRRAGARRNRIVDRGGHDQWIPAGHPAGVASALAEAQTAETLVEARNLTALVEELRLAAGPGRMDGRIDVELQRVAFLAPGGAGFEHGAVGHLHLDQVIIGVNILLHLAIPEHGWFPTSRKEAAPLQGKHRKGKASLEPYPAVAGGSAIMAVKLASAASLPSTRARAANLHTLARFCTNSTSSRSNTPGSTGA